MTGCGRVDQRRHAGVNHDGRGDDAKMTAAIVEVDPRLSQPLAGDLWDSIGDDQQRPSPTVAAEDGTYRLGAEQSLHLDFELRARQYQQRVAGARLLCFDV
jgi:hypothetical protein